jgi:hypothetical protein
MIRYISDYQRAVERKRAAREICDTIVGLIGLTVGAIGIVSIVILIEVL